MRIKRPLPKTSIKRLMIQQTVISSRPKVGISILPSNELFAEVELFQKSDMVWLSAIITDIIDDTITKIGI